VQALAGGHDLKEYSPRTEYGIKAISAADEESTMTIHGTTTKFEDFVEEVEARNTPEERRDLEDARARFRVGARLLRHRLSAGLTQTQLAEASGVAQADISRIERGQANPTTDTLEALCAPLGMRLDLVPARVDAGEE
jgi:ribosome-binding protein aMBF1 (putative translation factor)